MSCYGRFSPGISSTVLSSVHLSPGDVLSLFTPGDSIPTTCHQSPKVVSAKQDYFTDHNASRGSGQEDNFKSFRHDLCCLSSDDVWMYGDTLMLWGITGIMSVALHV